VSARLREFSPPVLSPRNWRGSWWRSRSCMRRHFRQ
jgi:hypothetical protein